MNGRAAWLLLAIAAAAAALWLALRPARHETAPTALPRDAANANVTSSPPPPEGQPTAAVDERRDAAPGRCAIRGRLVDAHAQPIAAGTIELVADGDAPRRFASAADGSFLIAPTPASGCTLLLDAPGFAPAQIGDLAPDDAPDALLDVGDVALLAAVTWHGRVVASGRGVADAEVRILPQLGGLVVPTVQSARTDEDGWFFFAAAPPPPCTITARAAGHRDATPLRPVDPAAELLLELTPLPFVRGRVVGPDRRPLASARVRLRTLVPDTPPGELPPPLDLDPTDTVAVDADGGFALPVPDEAPFAVTAIAAEHASLAFGPLAPTGLDAPLTLVLERGAIVAGTVTYHGEPVPAVVGLWPVAAPDGPPRVLQVTAADRPFELAPVPPGRWLLRVDSDGAARCEVELDLAVAGHHRHDVALDEGVRLVGRCIDRPRATAEIVCTHGSGRRVRGLLADDGTFALVGLFPGAWRAQVVTLDGTWQAHAEAMLGDLLAPLFTVVAGDRERRVDVPPAARRFGRVRGHLDAGEVGTLIELLPADALQERVPPGLRRATVGNDGDFVIDPVLPGTWRARWVARDGRTRDSTLEVAAGATADCTFP